MVANFVEDFPLVANLRKRGKEFPKPSGYIL